MSDGSQVLGARTVEGPLGADELRLIDAWWRAANYLSVGQIYLLDNPLLREPLAIEHVKPRLLGHWGTTPGLNFIYVHLNRVIKERDLDVIYITGPGHGGPGLVANTYLEGTYTEVYPQIGHDAEGLRRLFRQFSFPGGIPSHVAPETPGSIHEGGELGYALAHAFGAALDNPDLLVCCVVGDGEAEAGPLATSWHSNKFLNPSRDGAVLPILHLNGYKIANPTILARIPHEELEHLMRGYGYEPYFVEGSDPPSMHQAMSATLEHCVRDIRRIQQEARRTGADVKRPRWPMVILRSPKGWTGPKEVDGHKVEGFWRAHQVPLVEMHSEHTLEGWLEGYLLTGRHGFLSSYEAFVHVIDSMFNQHAKWLEKSSELSWRADVASLNLLITSTVWRQDHNGFTHQDPGFLDVVANKSPSVTRIYLPPDANCLLSVADHCLRSRNYANVIVADKQPHLQYLDLDAAVKHCTKGAGIWEWASSDQGLEPDLVMVGCGDVATMEALAATALLREHFADIRIRFINVV